MKNNLKEIILEALETDDSFSNKDNSDIINKYKKLDDLNKAYIDGIFINLTGYSLETLIYKYEKETKLI